MNNNRMKQNSPAVLALMEKMDLDGFIVPHADEFQGEYISDDNLRLRWLTGFTGSAGTAILYAGKVHLFVDGRYTLQAPQQVDPSLVTVHPYRDPTPAEWLQENVKAGERIGYDPRLHSITNCETFKKALRKKEAECVAVDENPIDTLWTDRPAPPCAPVHHHDMAYTGRSADDKITDIAQCLKEVGADAMVLNEMDSIAWTLNIRGGDTAHSPLTQSFALVHANGHAELFVNPDKLSEQAIAKLGNRTTPRDITNFANALVGMGRDGLTVALDKTTATDWTLRQLKDAGAKLCFETDPTRLQRARKNETEISGARAAHQRDALSVIRFLKWFDDEAPHKPLMELDISAKIEGYRRENDLFQGLSFSTIAAAGPNAAICHYFPTDESNRQLDQNSLLLLDSGAQYLDGTTDITRTLPVGTPDATICRHFTLVLKGHIAIASARFPIGTNGGQLDALARQHLWRAGLNYDHGTGHGVGSYLGVHEGPHRLASGSLVPFEPGMIISNEPGLYLSGQYGIRIESLLVVRISDEAESFLEFAPLTLVPIDRRLIEVGLLDNQERTWLDGYHQQVFDTLSEKLNNEDRQWLKGMCAPL